jgi:hypothetical protein
MTFFIEENSVRYLNSSLLGLELRIGWEQDLLPYHQATARFSWGILYGTAEVPLPFAAWVMHQIARFCKCNLACYARSCVRTYMRYLKWYCNLHHTKLTYSCTCPEEIWPSQNSCACGIECCLRGRPSMQCSTPACFCVCVSVCVWTRCFSAQSLWLARLLRCSTEDPWASKVNAGLYTEYIWTRTYGLR